ncbi:MAG: S-layer homology domain-containing protein [Ruminococcaceae bacterium]|nr:S-layer homology domain-containing protein [Oscillospiraceae bacterium]
MTISKKLPAAILAGIMTVGMAFSSFAALPSDVVDSPYEEAIETLSALDIMIGDDDGMFRPTDSIKRSEFAKVAVEAMGLGDVASASNHQTKYPDVVENHWANGYINVATEQGVVIGDDERNFRPDDSITYAEAMTILVRIIGHEPSALSKGGFPTGYMVVGSQNGISKNAAASANDKVVRGMVAQMTFNTLTVKMMEQVGFGNDERYEIVDKTLLADVLDVTKDSGQITALGISSISGSSSLKDNEVRIGDKVFSVSEEALPTVRNLLGFNVTYYVREHDNGDEELILARAEKNKNNATTVATDDIENVVAEEGKNTIVHYWLDKETDKNTKELTIGQKAQMIFNGKPVDFDAALLRPDSGRVTFLDIDNDDIHDLVFVTSFTNLVVESVIETSHKVTDKYGNPSLVLDPDDKDVKFTLTKAGHLIKLSDLNEWDVLSVAKSKDGSIISVEISSNRVTGKVEEIEDTKFFIDGKEYEVAKNYTGEIKLNDEGTFYLDIEGKIAAVDTSSTLSSNYAYAVAGEIATGFDKNLKLKVYTKEGETTILESGEKIKFNGANGKTGEEVLTALKSEGSFMPQLITYEVNAKGELTQLNTATDATDSGAINKNKFTLNAEGELTYKKASKKLGAYNVNAQTLIFNIPEGKTDPEDFAIETIDFFDDNEAYDVLLFDVAEDLTAKVVIVTSSAASANIEAPIAVVDQITTITNEDNERVQKLYAYQNGERLSFVTATDGLLVNGDDEPKALKRGDIIQLKLNTRNEISGIRVLFEAEDKATEFTTTIDEDMTIVYGKVTKKFASSINVQVADGAVANYSLEGATVYEVDTAKTNNAIKVVDANEITQYDESDPSRVFIRIYEDAVTEIVIIR